MYYIATKTAPSTLERFVTRIYRNRARLLLVFILIMGADILITALLPRLYESRMKILVRDYRADLVVSPGASTRTASPNEITENQVNNEIELLKSYDLLAAAVRACGLGPEPTGAEGRQNFEKAVKKLDHDLSVAPVRKSEVIQATYVAKSPETAQTVLRKVADLYMDAHIRAHSTSGTAGFFHRQALEYQKEMNEAEGRLNEFNRANNIVAIDTQKEVFLKKAAELDGDVKQTEASREDIATRNRRLREDLSSVGSRVVTQRRVLPNQYSVERLNTMLAELQNRRSAALMKFRPEDRIVKEIDEEIANTMAAAEKASTLSSVEESTDRNPLRGELESELARGALQESGLKAKLDSLTTSAQGFHSRLESLDSVALEHENLVRARTQAEQNVLLYTQKEEEARIADALDRQKIANVVITERPTGEHIATSPHVALNLCLGFLFAGFAGIGLAAAGEMSRPAFYIPGELEAGTGIAVLGAVPGLLVRKS